MTDSQSLNITPGMGVYGYFKHINYKSWYALAEFIDNAIQSFETKNGTFDTRNKCLINNMKEHLQQEFLQLTGLVYLNLE